MANFGKKRRITDFLYSKPAIAFLIVIVIFLSFAVYHRFIIEREMAARQMQTELEKQKLLMRKDALEKRVEYLSGERGMEEEIRKHFDVAKEGEQVVIIVDKEETAVVKEEPKEEVKPWYQFW